MSASRADTIAILFERAVELSGQDRTSFVVAEAWDDEMRLELESLLKASEAAGAYFDSFSEELMIEQTFARAIGRRTIGPYLVQEEAGQGGMGVVYRAIRDTNDSKAGFEQQVALKLIRREKMDERAMERFINERQILARLNHPNIARLLDGGVTKDGDPFLAMEWVEGLPILRYCDERQLTIDERLDLFAQVSRAVTHAHGQLVVHRDLKPSNILVSEDGTVKLLDFGIARMVRQGQVDLTLTGTRDRAMTPAYASPEQVAGEPVTTASDVYQLGLLLYELLVGTRAHVPGRTEAESQESILTRDPTKPSELLATPTVDGSYPKNPTPVAASRRTSIDALQRRLKGDLDNIVMLALRKEPQQRYPSAEAFLADIRNHLEGRPVVARPQTIAYRTSRFLTRHKAGTFIALLVTAYAITATFLGLQSASDRDAAIGALNQADAVADFVVSVFEAGDPATAKGEPISVDDLLERGTRRMENELAGQPEVRARLAATLGRLNANLGKSEEAGRLYQEALALREQILPADHPDIAISRLQLATNLGSRAMLDQIDSLYQLALPVLEANDMVREPENLAALSSIAILRSHEGNMTAARQSLRQVADQASSPDRESRLIAARAMHQLGQMEMWASNRSVAESLFVSALHTFRDIHGEVHPSVAKTVESLFSVSLADGNSVAADSLLHVRLAIETRLYGVGHPKLGSTYLALSQQRLYRNEHVAADSLATLGLQVVRGTEAESENGYAQLLSLKARSKHGIGDVDSARHYLVRAVDAANGPKPHQQLQYALNLLYFSSFELAQHHPAESERLVREAVDALRTNPMRNMHTTRGRMANALAMYARIAHYRGNLDEADSLFAEALESVPDLDVRSASRASIAQDYGQFLLQRGKLEQAEHHLLVAFDVLKDLPASRASLGRALHDLYLRMEMPEKAKNYLTLSDSS